VETRQKSRVGVERSGTDIMNGRNGGVGTDSSERGERQITGERQRQVANEQTKEAASGGEIKRH